MIAESRSYAACIEGLEAPARFQLQVAVDHGHAQVARRDIDGDHAPGVEGVEGLAAFAEQEAGDRALVEFVGGGGQGRRALRYGGVAHGDEHGQVARG